jgi:hypothetical protein
MWCIKITLYGEFCCQGRVFKYLRPAAPIFAVASRVLIMEDVIIFDAMQQQVQ